MRFLSCDYRSCWRCAARVLWAVLLVLVSFGTLTATETRTDDDVAASNTRFRAIVIEKDIDKLLAHFKESYAEALRLYGASHWETLTKKRSLAEIRQLHGSRESLQHAFWEAEQELIESSRLLARRGTRTTPSPLEAPRLLSRLQDAQEALAQLDCWTCDIQIAEMALVLGQAEARRWDAAAKRALDALETPVLGFDLENGHAAKMKLLVASVLMEAEQEPKKQIKFAEAFLEFANRYATKERLAFWPERGLTLLAEIHYRNGNHAEADRLYAQVRTRLPDKTDDTIAGWCKSWCDRHEARQLMEKGDWEGAYDKILLARTGTIDYGHRNLSKGLTMERILRMSAEIQAKRGKHEEAQEDLEYARLIADNAARLRAALEADLDDRPEVQGQATD